MVLCDAGIKHRVETVLSGTRLVVAGSIESLIRSSDIRDVLRDVRKVIGLLGPENSDSEEVITLRRIYAQILRMFAET